MCSVHIMEHIVCYVDILYGICIARIVCPANYALTISRHETSKNIQEREFSGWKTS